jgi:hydrogenase-4 component D
MAELVPLLLLLLVLPVGGACCAGVLSRRASDAAATVFVGATLLLLLGIFNAAGGSLFEENRWGLAGLAWLPATGDLFGLMLDPLSALMLLVILLIGFLVILYSWDYVGPYNAEHATPNGKGRYYFWMLLFIGAMVGVAVSPNFLQLFIFWELTSLCSWALISYYEDPRSLAGGYKALIMTHLGGLFLMTAVVILFVHTGSFDFQALGQAAPGVRTLLFVLILVGAWSKAAQGPFYTWLPDAMAAPTPVSAYLHAAAMVKAGVYVVARTVISTAGLSYGEGLVVALVALVTLFGGLILFFYQDDLKRLLALSTITHLAYILMGCVLGIFGSPLGLQGGVLHIAAHGVGKALLFLSVGAVAYASGSRRISELEGVGRRLPLAAAGFFVGAFTVTGVPPLAGFWSKWMLISGALQRGGVGSWLAALMVLESLIAFGWFLWVGQRVFCGQPSPVVARIGRSANPHSPTPSPAEQGSSPPLASMEVVLGVLMLLCLLMPVLALPLATSVGM